MFPAIRYINDEGQSAFGSLMTNPTYNPIGFGVGSCGYAACDYECADDYHRDPTATGDVFRAARGELGACVYNYRLCNETPPSNRNTISRRNMIAHEYNTRHFDRSHRPDYNHKLIGNLAQQRS
jgi:hypothetical protein